jgi:signal transduction histidine kinase
MFIPNTGLILIVDDTANNLEVMSETLTDEGFEVSTALTGDRALEQVQYSEPDLILLDVMMPGIDGFETCKRLKADSKTSSIPIIFMTALADTDSKVKGFDLGAVDYITKPFQEREVIARVRTHLHLRNLSKQLEQQLVQSEKMSTLGNLIAGIAHEINNPISCITGNLPLAKSYYKDLLSVIRCYQNHYPQPVAEITNILKDVDLGFLQGDLPKLIDSMQASIRRIEEISTSLRIYSRGDQDVKVHYDIHDGLNSTLLILKHRLKGNPGHVAIEVITDYGNLPPIECYAGQVSQVFMNLLANAIDAINAIDATDVIEARTHSERRITITTQLTTDRQSVMIQIKDTGIGMSPEVQAKIFDRLYTTKEVGKGTGLGLAIARQVIVEMHHGELKCISSPGNGTEFTIQIPLK